MNASNQINPDVEAEQQGATMDETDAVNPAVPAVQQGAARFKQLNRVVQQVLLLAAFALSDIFTAFPRETCAQSDLPARWRSMDRRHPPLLSGVLRVA